jgi:aldehyde:ferredoxin oxidoreductase
MTKETPGGYNGKILRVNLTSQKTATEVLDGQFCRRYIGGAGFVIYYLWKELRPGADALGPDNKLIFALGPVSGLQLPGAARHCLGAKSPLTGGIAKAEVGGYWGAELKRACYDAIIVEGKADKPVYLWVQDGVASLRDASHLWGMEVKETEAAVRAELGDERIRLALIGPAGENRVRYACIMHGCFDAAGRGGLGAVMGSKNLKAVAVRGHTLPGVTDRERIKEIRQQLISVPNSMSEFGTGGPVMLAFESSGNLPVRNFRDGLFPQVNQIHGGVIKDTIRIGMRGCFACPVRCKKVVQFEEPYHVDSAYGGPEYETLAALGSNCGIDNLKAIAKANERCGAYSLDTISTGVTIAFAMECFEKGLLTAKDTDGIELRFGNEEAMLKVIDLIARRQGIGDRLAEGTARLARQIGRGSEEFAMHVKGLECGLHEPRFKKGLGLGFMVNPCGADHCCNMHDEMMVNEIGIKQFHPLGILDPLPLDEISARKASLLRLVQFLRIMCDSLVVCSFVPYTWELEANVLKAVTGWDTGIAELLRVAERIMTTAKLFNVREGFTSADDVLPERFFQPKTDGVLSDTHLDRAKYEKARSFYYALMAWDHSGVPLPEKVEELEIQ